MTDSPVSQSEAPAKKPGNTNNLIAIVLVAIILLIAIVTIFGGPVFNDLVGSNVQNASNVIPTVSVPAVVPAATEMPTAEIVTKMVTCQVTGLLDITGIVQSNVNHPLYVAIYGAGYDSNGVELGTGYDTVEIDPMGTSTYKINVIDGCQLGDMGTYEVRISDITWRHSS